jgi:hypothetical protein
VQKLLRGKRWVDGSTQKHVQQQWGKRLLEEGELKVLIGQKGSHVWLLDVKIHFSVNHFNEQAERNSSSIFNSA